MGSPVRSDAPHSRSLDQIPRYAEHDAVVEIAQRAALEPVIVTPLVGALEGCLDHSHSRFSVTIC